MSQDFNKSTLRVCRGCLATDVRLYDMHQNRLMEAYNRLVPIKDNLPDYLCSYCATLLLKCDTFRIKCFHARLILENAQCENEELTMEELKKIDRKTNKFTIPYKRTQQLTVNIVKNPKNIDPSEPIYVIDECSNDSSVSETKHDDNNDTGTTDCNIETLSEVTDVDESVTTVTVVDKLYDYIIPMKSVVTEDVEFISDETEMNETESDEQGEVLLYVSDEMAPKHLGEEMSSVAEETVTDKLVKLKNRVKKNCKTTEFILLNNLVGRHKPELSTKSVLKSKIHSRIMKRITDRDTANEKCSKVKVNDTGDVVIDLTDKGDSAKSGKYKCNFCRKVYFTDKESWTKHNNIHDEIGNFVCGICKSKFKDYVDYVKHKMNHKTKYSCKICGFTTNYTNRQYYYMHVRLAHKSTEDWIRCEICGESFTGPRGFNIHEKTIHKEMTSPECFCPGCDTQFFCLEAYTLHQGTDGLCESTAKYCVRCGMSFETKELLREHSIEQRKPRDIYDCKYCGMKFSNRHHYLWHRKIHKNNIKRVDGSAIYTKHTDVNNPYQHFCKYCLRKFNSVLALKKHERTHPPGPYLCGACGCFYDAISSMRNHINKVHKDLPIPPTILHRKIKT